MSAGARWGAALAAALALASAACGPHRSKTLVQPPMPPGVTWGRPGAAAPAPSSASPVSVARPGIAPALDGPLRVGDVFAGVASYYGPEEQGQPTASGVPFDDRKMTAAHRTLPFGTRLRVTYLATGRSVVVTINDRGPFWPHRILDLSLGAARRLGLYDHGLGQVRYEIVGLPRPVPPGRYTVQVGWFTSAAALQRCRRRMRRAAEFRVVEFHSSSGAWLRYDRGASLDADEASRIVSALRAHDFPAYVVRLN